jgi:hypothetical protein
VERLVRNEQNDRDIFITEILNEVGPVDVSHLLPKGRTEVRFKLCDFGRIAGNTELFLVIRDRPQCSVSQCVADAQIAHAQALDQCAEDADACVAASGFGCFEEQQLCVTRADVDFQRDLGGPCAQCTQ